MLIMKPYCSFLFLYFYQIEQVLIQQIMISKTLLIILGLMIVVSCSYKKQLTATRIILSAYYADSMILQASPVVQIAGQSEPGAVLAVKIDNYLKMAKADKSGQWRVIFPEIINSDPFRLTIEGNGITVSFRHVQAGRLIVLAGNTGRSYFAAATENSSDDTLPKLRKNIRVFRPEQAMAMSPKEIFTKGKWHSSVETSWIKTHRYDIAVINQIITNNKELTGVIDISLAGTSTDAWLPENSAFVYYGSMKK